MTDDEYRDVRNLLQTCRDVVVSSCTQLREGRIINAYELLANLVEGIDKGLIRVSKAQRA